MKFDAIKTPAVGASSGTAFVPAGRFTTFRDYSRSSQPARIRKLPVLQGFFTEIGLTSSPAEPRYVGWGALPLGDTVALTFRLQVGADMLYWLVDPSDREAWRALDSWAAAGKMVLAAEFPDGPAHIVIRDYDLRHPGMRAIRDTAFGADYATRFMAEALTLVASGGMNAAASSDIPSIPVLRRVQACVVARGN